MMSQNTQSSVGMCSGALRARPSRMCEVMALGLSNHLLTSTDTLPFGRRCRQAPTRCIGTAIRSAKRTALRSPSLHQ